MVAEVAVSKDEICLLLLKLVPQGRMQVDSCDSSSFRICDCNSNKQHKRSAVVNDVVAIGIYVGRSLPDDVLDGT